MIHYLPPASSGGGGDATAANQVILNALINNMRTDVHIRLEQVTIGATFKVLAGEAVAFGWRLGDNVLLTPTEMGVSYVGVNAGVAYPAEVTNITILNTNNALAFLNKGVVDTYTPRVWTYPGPYITAVFCIISYP